MPDRADNAQPSPTRVPFDQMRFRVALSFPGEKRVLVEDVANRLAENLPRKEIFYDNWYRPHLARPAIDLSLQDIYHKRSELLVVFLCAEYEQKEWCGVEWRAIRDLIKQRKEDSIMLVRLDDAPVSGVLSVDGFLDARRMASEELADCILERLGAEVQTPPQNCHGLFTQRRISGPFVLCSLPRGLLLIEKVLPLQNPNWSLVASYYHYGEGWRHGTHYHPSYFDRWEDRKAIEVQCRKTGIPQADSDYSHWPFHLMTRIGECCSLDEVRDAVTSYSSDESSAILYLDGETPNIGTFEKQHLDLKRSGSLRDLRHELVTWKEVPAQRWGDRNNMTFAFSLSYRLITELAQILGSNHPSFLLATSLLQQHQSHKSDEEFWKWLELVDVALIDSIQLVSKDAITRK